jgi:CheY-like chemotaxis protein
MREVIRCLFVDDDTDDQDFFKIIMAEIGDHIQFDVASDGFDALNILESYTDCPDFIFLDVHMPKMDGFELLHEIRKQSRFDNCKVFTYTTSIHPSIIESSEFLNAVCITKPNNISDLRKILREIISS